MTGLNALKAEVQYESQADNLPSQQQFSQWLLRCFPNQVDETVLIRLVDIPESTALNEQYRGKSGPTNILSFPFDVPEHVPNQHLGDLVICAPIVCSEATAQGKPLTDHWAHLLVHGVLHLLGYDHITEPDAREMEALEVKLLQNIGISDPYRDFV
ncbi:MAG TPA: rRNA maturation RNase YbeY [Gammaproteobacteria bacterium]|nr:rRNA maturation RNase YbeY [Gammaproteobacteria bacterium]